MVAQPALVRLGWFALGRALTGALLLLIMSGCPRNVQAPDRPGRAESCTQVADCQPDAGVLCGALRNCVDLRCEAEPSLFVPCSAPLTR